MKVITVSLTFLMIMFSQSVYAQSGWKWIYPYPHANTVFSMAAVGNNTYFLASKSTFSVSRDTGKAVDNLAIYGKTGNSYGGQKSLAFLDSLNGFLIDPDEGEFRTTDGGKSWKQTFRMRYRSVVFADSKTGWEAGLECIADSTSIAKTTDGGVTWFEQHPISRLDHSNTGAIYALDSLNIWISAESYQTNKIGNLYYSSDGGNSWSVQPTGLTPDSTKQIWPAYLKINKSGLGILLASVIKKGTSWVDKSIILRTENFGKTWAVVDSSIEGPLSNIISVNDSLWIIHGQGKDVNNATVQYRSTDFGKTFSGGNIITPGDNGLLFITSAYNPQQKVIYLAAAMELYRSLDFGKTYSRITSENTLRCFDFALDNNTSGSQLATAVSTLNDRFLLSQDGGRTWYIKPFSLAKEDKGQIKGVEVSQGAIFIFTDEYLYISTDRGGSWSNYRHPSSPDIHFSAYSCWNFLVLSDTYLQSPDYDPALWLYAGDKGIYWKEVPIPPNYKFNAVKLTGPKEITGCGSHSDSTGSSGFVFTSSNWGSDWRIIQTEDAFRDASKAPGNLGYGFSDKKVYTTEDNWKTIKAVYDINSSRVIEDVNFPDSAHGILRANWNFYETFDRGNSWQQSGLDMPMTGSVKKMRYNNQGDLLVLGYDGFIIKLNEKSSKGNAGQNENIHTMSYELFQNYPNPFNPVTQISFRLAEKGPVELKIFDIIGREVKTLVSEVKDAGTYSIPFNAAELPSGIYIYRLKAGAQTLARKMLLLK